MANEDLAVTPDNPDSQDRPEWLPSNFDEPQALVDSYKEAQRKITEEATARRNLEQLVAQQQSAIEQLQQVQQQPAEDESQWYDAYNEDPVTTTKSLAEAAARAEFQRLQQSQQQQYAPLAASQTEVVAGLAFQQLERERGELNEDFRTVMSGIIAERPHLIPEQAYQSPAALKSALDVVADLATLKTGAAPSQGTSPDLMRTMKLNAQTSDGAPGRPGPEDAAVQRWSEIANAKSDKLGL